MSFPEILIVRAYTPKIPHESTDNHDKGKIVHLLYKVAKNIEIPYNLIPWRSNPKILYVSTNPPQ
jgi:hypothetical protein